jgi:hypothetical protein
VQDALDALYRTARKRQVRKIPFEKLHARNVIDVAPLACDQAVRDADYVAAADEFFCEMGADETGASGDEVLSHTLQLSNIRAQELKVKPVVHY